MIFLQDDDQVKCNAHPATSIYRINIIVEHILYRLFEDIVAMVLFLFSVFVRFMIHLPFEPYPITNFMNIIKSILLNGA